LFSSILGRFQLDAIPTVGSGGWLGSWLAGFKYLTNALDVVQEGYDKVSLVLCACLHVMFVHMVPAQASTIQGRGILPLGSSSQQP
jgi:hypothetical protein